MWRMNRARASTMPPIPRRGCQVCALYRAARGLLQCRALKRSGPSTTKNASQFGNGTGLRYRHREGRVFWDHACGQHARLRGLLRRWRCRHRSRLRYGRLFQPVAVSSTTGDPNHSPPTSAVNLLEIVDDRYDKGSLPITSQVPVSQWHDVIADPTLGDAILDRIIHNAHRIELKGDSLRRRAGEKKAA